MTPAERNLCRPQTAAPGALKAVAAGDRKIDVVTTVTPAEAMASESDHAKIVMDKAQTVLVDVCSQNKPNAPWRDINIRRAMNMAIDRKALIETGENGHAARMPAMIQQGRFGYATASNPAPTTSPRQARC